MSETESQPQPESESKPRPTDVFDVERIRQLVELMEEHNLRELDLKQAEQQMRLCRGAEMMYGTPQMMVPTPAAAPTPPATGATMTTGAASDSEPDDGHIALVKSPMVGTFYLRSNPNAEPYVKIGDVVEPETTICIIEAMKVFNEIPAEVRGKIVAVLVDDEEPVDYGRPLFKIDTRAG